MVVARTLARVLLVVLSVSAAHGDEAPEALVARLPTSFTPSYPVETRALEARIADLGDVALDALERELQLGLRGRESQAFRDSGRSRRCAVVRVLARIPGSRSTALLVRSLEDPPDNLAMRDATLAALAERVLPHEAMSSLLASREPAVVLFALRRLGAAPTESPYRPSVERLFDEPHAAAWFRNEHGNPTATPDQRWQVRLGAGHVLGVDMVPEMRARASVIVARLAARSELAPAAEQGEFLYDFSRDEIDVLTDLGRLKALGPNHRPLVVQAQRGAGGDARVLLEMALAMLGDATRVPALCAVLADARNPSLRVLAAHVLRTLKDPRAKPALWKALEDPFRRQTGCCVRIGDGMVHPVRLVAADALVDLGEDPVAVRARAAGTPAPR